MKDKALRRQILLVKTMLRASGGRNIWKYETDKKKRRRLVGEVVGKSILYVCLALYCAMVAVGLGFLGLADAIPGVCALTVCLMEFAFGLFRAGGYLFAGRDGEMLLAMPFSVRTVVAGKFLFMYCKLLPFALVCSLSMLIPYSVFARPLIYVDLLWVVLTLLLPMIPLVVTSLLSVLLTGIASGFRHKNILQSILIFAVVIAVFLLRFLLPGMVEDGAVEQSVEALSEETAHIGGYYLPVQWFSDAVTKHSVAAVLLLVGVSVVLYEAAFLLLGRFYCRIVSRLANAAGAKHYHLGKLKRHSAVYAVAHKELRFFLESPTYLTNMGLGQILCVLLSVVVLFVDVERVIAVVMQDAPVTKEMLLPAVPVVIYFLLGMVSTTAVSYSLEGRQLWIVESLPLPTLTLLKGKLLFQLWISVPFMVLSSLCFGIAFRAGIAEILLFLLCGFSMCLFSAVFGMLCGVKFVRFDWEREIEVIKQGAAVAVYLFPNMILTSGLLVGAVVLGLYFGAVLALMAVTAVYVLLTLLIFAVLSARMRKTGGALNV